MTPCTLESALRLLWHARNSHGRLRTAIRAEIHRNVTTLRLLRLPETMEIWH
jgi:hypothetical protein